MDDDKLFYLVRDLGGHLRVIRSPFASLADAKSQAQADMEHGDADAVLRIESVNGSKIYWTPLSDEGND